MLIKQNEVFTELMLPELLNKEPVVSLWGEKRWNREARGGAQQYEKGTHAMQLLNLFVILLSMGSSYT